MKKMLCLFMLAFCLWGCGSKPAPDWFAAGHQQLETFTTDFLTGRAPLIAETHFRNAVEEVKKSGDLELLGRVWLTRMALQAAVLENRDDGEYGRIAAAQAVPANDQFHLFLTGDPARVDGALLGAQYRPLLLALQRGSSVDAEAAVAAIDDPLSRLIAAGLAVRRNLESGAIIEKAVETASQRGWKRALLAWLKRLESFHERAGEAAKVALVRQRIDLIGP